MKNIGFFTRITFERDMGTKICKYTTYYQMKQIIIDSYKYQSKYEIENEIIRLKTENFDTSNCFNLVTFWINLALTVISLLITKTFSKLVDSNVGKIGDVISKYINDSIYEFFIFAIVYSVVAFIVFGVRNGYKVNYYKFKLECLENLK